MSVLIHLVLITVISIQVLQAEECTTTANCQFGSVFQDQTVTESCGWLRRKRCTKLVRVCVCAPAAFIRNLCQTRTDKKVFYLADPRNNKRFIQCDEFDQAFLQNCPIGTVWDDTNKRCEFD